MFLHILNDAEQKAFLALARHFIEVDRHLADEEQNLLELMRAEMNLSFDDELPAADAPVEDPKALLAAIGSRQAQVAALLELIAAGHADNDFRPEESAFVQEAAAAWNISPAELARMEEWVRRQQALIAEAETFWAAPDS